MNVRLTMIAHLLNIVKTMDAKTHVYKEGLLESGDIATLGAEGADLSAKMVVAVGHEKFT